MFLHRAWVAVVGILIIYLFLCAARAATAQPWNDEAWYSSPSWSLIVHGNTGTPILEATHKFWKGINQRTYWVVPLQFFVQVPWIKVFGFSLFAMRAYAMFWGLVALGSWAFSIWKLTGSTATALVAMFLMACDYQFDSQVSLARMDAMALGLASLAVALYLQLRQKDLRWAIGASQMAVVACGLTHPTAGVPAFAALAFLTLYLDLRKLRLIHAAFAAIPYLLGAAFWGWYISEAPDLFKAQFFGNVTDIDRLGGFAHPIRAIVGEFFRYLGMAGFALGMHPLYRIKAAVILVYLVAVVAVLSTREIREQKGYRTLIGLWLTYFLTMTFYENTKEVKYAIHIVALYDVLLAVLVVYWWYKPPLKRAGALALASVFIVVSAGGLLYTSFAKDDYHQSYLPAAEFVNSRANRQDLILAGSEFGFALGFDRNMVDDEDFTYYTRKKPKYILISNNYRGLLRHSKQTHPEIAKYFEDLINQHYRRVYAHGEYEVYERLDDDGRALVAGRYLALR